MPRLRRPLSSLSDLSDVCQFTYCELDIGNFILPAVYQGLFDRILWLKHKHSATATGSRELAICTRNPEGTEFLTARSAELPEELAPTDVQRFQYSYVQARHAPAPVQRFILDIDMDYFCCNDSPDLTNRELEVTAATYDEFHRNRYHFLRISPGAKVSAIKRNDRYWLIYEDLPGRCNTACPENGILEKIQEFMRYLEGYPRPDLIVLCRSLHSGYLPREMHKFVETNLIAALDQRYGLDKIFIDDILPRSFATGRNYEKN